MAAPAARRGFRLRRARRVRLYPKVGAEFADHQTVKHSAGEHARGPKGPGGVHTNGVEGFFGAFERGMRGICRHCGEQRFQRYLDELASRRNHRSKPCVADAERARIALRGADGKRLTYRRIGQAAHA